MLGALLAAVALAQADPTAFVSGSLTLDVSAESLATLKQANERTARDVLGAGLSTAIGTGVKVQSLDLTVAKPVVKYTALDELYFDEISELMEGGELLAALNDALADPFPTVAILSVTMTKPTVEQGCVSLAVTNGANCSDVGLAYGEVCRPSCVAGYRPTPEELKCTDPTDTLQFACNPLMIDQVVNMSVCGDGVAQALPGLTAAVAAYLGVEALDVRAEGTSSTKTSILYASLPPDVSYDLQSAPRPMQSFFGVEGFVKSHVATGEETPSPTPMPTVPNTTDWVYHVIATMHVFGDAAETDLAALVGNSTKYIRLEKSIPCFVGAEFDAPNVSLLSPCQVEETPESHESYETSSTVNVSGTLTTTKTTNTRPLHYATTCAGSEIPLAGTCAPKCKDGMVPSTELLTCIAPGETLKFSCQDGCFAAKRARPPAALSSDVPSKILIISGSKDGTAGSYFQESTEKFMKDDKTWELVWDGCVWSLKQRKVGVILECPDDDAAADELFGNFYSRDANGDAVSASSLGFGSLSDKADNPGACATAVVSGYDYCRIPSFAAVCAGSCGTKIDRTLTTTGCTGDNDAGFADFAEFMGQYDKNTMSKCSHAVDECDHKIVAAICKSTCSHPNAINPKTYHYDSSIKKPKTQTNTAYEAAFGSFPTRRMLSLDQRRTARRLDYEMKEVLHTYVNADSAEVYIFMDTMPGDGVPVTCTAANKRDPTAIGPRGKTGVEALTTSSVCKTANVLKQNRFKLSYDCGEKFNIVQNHLQYVLSVAKHQHYRSRGTARGVCVRSELRRLGQHCDLRTAGNLRRLVHVAWRALHRD
jgi:hypothetical protein